MAQYRWPDCPRNIKGQVDELVTFLRDTMGDWLRGVYLHGSLAMGCFNPRRSDIDVLAVVKEMMSPQSKMLIAKYLLARSGSPRPVEISILSTGDLHPWQYPTPFDFHFSEDWRKRMMRQIREGFWTRSLTRQIEHAGKPRNQKEQSSGHSHRKQTQGGSRYLTPVPPQAESTGTRSIQVPIEGPRLQSLPDQESADRDSHSLTPEKDSDLAAHITILKSRGICLFGEQIDKVFPDVPATDYLRSIMGDFTDCVTRLHSTPVYSVLNMLRVYYYLTEGVISSKQEAGQWAIGSPTIPGNLKQVIRRILAAYSGAFEDEYFDSASLVRISDYLNGEVKALLKDRSGQPH